MAFPRPVRASEHEYGTAGMAGRHGDGKTSTKTEKSTERKKSGKAMNVNVRNKNPEKTESQKGGEERKGGIESTTGCMCPVG